MTKRLVILINKEIALGKTMNALGHMSGGLGPRIPTNCMPKLSIHAATAEQVRAFRALAVCENQRLGDAASLLSDFAHTTTEGSARDHHDVTRAILERDIGYFAACFAADECELAPIQDFIQQQVIQQTAWPRLLHEEEASAADFDFCPPITSCDDFVADDNACCFSLALAPKLSESIALAAVVTGAVRLSQQIPVASLRLHHYLDADNTIHPGMSEYGLVAIKGKKANCITELTHADLSHVEAHAVVPGLSGQPPLAMAFFGPREAVKRLTAKGFSLWSGSLDNLLLPSTTSNSTRVPVLNSAANFFISLPTSAIESKDGSSTAQLGK